MNRFVCVLTAALSLCLLCQVNAESRLSRSFIEETVNEAKASVDSAYEYSRRESLDRVKRSGANPAEVLRLLKQPVGSSRIAVRAADYFNHAVHLVKRSLDGDGRYANSTELSEEELQLIANLTGCSPEHRAPSCRRTPNSNKFRTASSVCNNLQNTRWGSSNTPFNRWLAPEYQDGISLPKGWDPERPVNQHLLPLVREVSNHILRFTDDAESDPLYTHMVTIFAQWTDHDLTLTPQSPVIRSFNSSIDCDSTCERTEPCFPIKIPSQDPRFGSNSRECIHVFRSAPVCDSGTGHSSYGRNTRQQMNALTAFIDVGQVYGSDDTTARSLRNLTTDEGLLKVNTNYTDHGREHLPFKSMGTNMCATRARTTGVSNAEEVPCFLAGDVRVDENIGLTSLHTLMMREHNRLARALAKLNPHWDGERLYQEARKIIGGYFQVLTFRDYLLHIVGPDFIARQLSTYPGYDPNVDASIANVFATAAYRFAHLMIQPIMFRLDENYAENRKYPSPFLHKAFFTPWRVLFEGGVDPILRGLVGRPAKLGTQERMMTDELRDKLFQFSAKMALDLGSLNMQRGRDHGLPGYNKWRKFCGLSQPQNLPELAAVMNNRALAKKLLDLYGTPANIDVWLGGVAEPPVTGGRVGPLFACIISTQFQNIRKGDRFWWENEGVFTEAQRRSLRETSLARIICDNTGITEVPEKPFQYRPRGRGYTRCEHIPTFNLRPWKEHDDDDDDDDDFHGPPGHPRQPSGTAVNVAFSMRLGNSHPQAGRPIIFTEVIYNGQNRYNIGTGIFTCENPGVYEFQFHVTIWQSDASVDLMRNGARILHSFTTRQSGSIMASGNIYIKLQKGDRLWLVASQGGSSLTSDSFFSGHLLFTE